jgi:hypothetical protein
LTIAAIVLAGLSGFALGRWTGESHRESEAKAAEVVNVDGGDKGHSPMPRILHRWRFKKDTGDSVGRADGVPITGAKMSAEGVALDGKYAYVELPVGETIKQLTSSTFEVWFSCSSDPLAVHGTDAANLCHFGTGPSRYMSLSVQDERSEIDRNLYALRFLITLMGNRGTRVLTSPVRLPPDQKIHMAVTIDSDSNIVRVYLDGNLAAEQRNVTVTPADLGQTTDNWLGRSHSDSGRFFHGSIFEFRIYRGALPQEQIRKNSELGPDRLTYGF